MNLPTHAEARAQLERLAAEAETSGGVVSTELELAPGDANYWTINGAAKALNKTGAKITTVRDLRNRKITLTARPSS